MTLKRRDFLAGTAAGGLVGSLGGRAFAQSSKTGSVRVWGEPGPYGGVAVAAMNDWAQKNAPGLKFEIETIPWDGVYVKLMTDLAARRPPALISVESPSPCSSWRRSFSCPSTMWSTRSDATGSCRG